MKSNATLLLSILFLLGTASGLRSQEVWPGDINNNGIVNGVDLLYLGIAFGSTGPERTSGNGDWQAQPLTALWTQSFPDGTNYAYADCNGDGVVDEDDIKDAIDKNFSLRHGTQRPDDFGNGLPGIDPPLVLQAAQAVVGQGATNTIRLDLGAMDLPVDEFYGIALSFSYRADLTAGDDGPDFEIEDGSWINPSTRPKVQKLLYTDEQLGRGELAITRTDQAPLGPGFGSIGQFTVVIEDIIVGLEVDTFIILIDSVKLIDTRLNTHVITPGKGSFLVARNPDSITAGKIVPGPGLTIFPNPARGFLHVTSDLSIDQVVLFNAVGQPVPVQATPAGPGAVRIDTSRCPAGIYLLRMYFGGQVVTAKISLLNQ